MSIVKKLWNLVPRREALAGRAMAASIWSIVELGISHGLRLASNLIMTRLLLPEAFGLMAMITTLHIGMTLLTDIGISQSVTRSERGEDPLYLRVVWVVQIVRSGAIAGMIILAAVLLWWLSPTIAPPNTVYTDADLPALVAVSSLVVLFNGLGSTNRFVAARQMKIPRIAALNISTQIVSIGAMLTLAQIEATVWTLLWGMIIGAAFDMVLSHFIFPGPTMRMRWDKTITDEVWQFGKWIMGSSGLAFIAGNADRFILAALLDKERFGFYVIAILWVQAFTMVIGRLAGQVVFPALSEVLRDNPQQLRSVLSRFTLMADIICIIGAVAFFFGGSWLISFLYPEPYAVAGSFVPILALTIFRERYHILSQLLLSDGDSKATMMETTASAVAVCLLLPLGYHFLEMKGALFAIALAPLAGCIPIIIRTKRIIGDEIHSHIVWFVGICLVGAVVYFITPAI